MASSLRARHCRASPARSWQNGRTHEWWQTETFRLRYWLFILRSASRREEMGTERMGSERYRDLCHRWLQRLEGRECLCHEASCTQQRHLGNQTSCQGHEARTAFQTLCPLGRRTGRTHTSLGYASRARRSDQDILGTGMVSGGTLQLEGAEVQA